MPDARPPSANCELPSPALVPIVVVGRPVLVVPIVPIVSVERRAGRDVERLRGRYGADHLPVEVAHLDHDATVAARLEVKLALLRSQLVGDLRRRMPLVEAV